MIDGKISKLPSYVIKPVPKCYKFKKKKDSHLIFKNSENHLLLETKKDIKYDCLVLYNAKGKIVIHNLKKHEWSRYV